MSDYKYELERDDRLCKETESENARLEVAPQDIGKFQNWLRAKEVYLIKEISDNYLKGLSKQVVRLVIATLLLELQTQAEISMDEMARSIEREG